MPEDSTKAQRLPRIKLRIKANVTDEQMQELGSLGPMFSPVFDSLTKGVPISVAAERLA